MGKDYYKILGVAKGATDAEIKKAYRTLAHKYHPDKKGGDEARFKEINEAYQILSDKTKKANYDRYGNAEPFSGSGGFNWGGAGFEGIDPSAFGDMGDLGEIFESFFEGIGIRPKRRTYNRGSDIETSLEITLEEAFRGVIRELKIKTYVRCSDCHGRGADHKEGYTTCSACAGQGEVKEQSRTFFGSFYQVKTCKECSGTGQIPNKACEACRGNGRKNAERKVSVEILPGVQNGQIIKIKGAGEAGERGAEEGDLYIQIRVALHSVFARRGDDLVVKKDIELISLLLGKKLEIPTITNNKISIEIPAHFNLKEELRIRGEGMPHFGNIGRGDLLINFTIRAPKKLNSKAKQLLEDLEKEL